MITNDLAVAANMPTMDEVVAHAMKKADFHLSQLPKSIPPEQREDMRQNALMRVVEKYSEIDPSKGWKTYVDTHCWGAIQDYQKAGKGFEEQKQTYKKAAEARKEERIHLSNGNSLEDFRPKVKQAGMTYRIEVKETDVGGSDSDAMDVEEILGMNGKSYIDNNEFENKIKWDLVARMASVDHTIHLVAKVILDFDIAELANTFGVTRERLSQRFHAFLAEARSPFSARDPWLNQALYAFGVGDDIKDNGLGYEYQPIDLYSLRPIEEDRGLHVSAMGWVKDLYPDLLSVKKADIDWELVSRMARYDEALHMVASVLLGKTQREICDYFDIGMAAARKKIQRFIDKLDAPEFYEDKWVKQVIAALGLAPYFGQSEEMSQVGLFGSPIDLEDFTISRSFYDRGEQLSLIVIPGEILADGSELKKTRSLRKLKEDREDNLTVEQVDMLGLIS